MGTNCDHPSAGYSFAILGRANKAFFTTREKGQCMNYRIHQMLALIQMALSKKPLQSSTSTPMVHSLLTMNQKVRLLLE